MQKPAATWPKTALLITLAAAAAILLVLSPVARGQIGAPVVDASGEVTAIDLAPLFSISCDIAWVERSNGPTGRTFTRRFTVDVPNARWWVFDGNPRWEYVRIFEGYLDRVRGRDPDVHRMSIELATGQVTIVFALAGQTGRAEGVCVETELVRPTGP